MTFEQNAKYEVGYGKPPKGSRFKEGTSGNPKGRPKGTRNFQTDLRAVLGAKVTVTENGKPRKVSSQFATLMRLREKALMGDSKALDKYIDLAKEQSFEDGARQAERKISGAEEGILQRYVDSVLQVKTGNEAATGDQDLQFGDAGDKDD